MSATQLQATSGVNSAFASTVNATFANNLTPSSTIIVTFNADVTTTRANTPTDTALNTYVKAIQSSVGVNIGEDCEVWYAHNIKAIASNKVTVTDNGGGVDSNIIIEEWSGLLVPSFNTSAVAQDGVAGTAIDSGATGTLAQTNELVIIHAWNNLNSNSLSLAGSFTGLTQTHNTSPTGIGTASRVVAATTAVHGLMTTASADWVGLVTTWMIANSVKQNNRGLRPHPFSPGLAR